MVHLIMQLANGETKEMMCSHRIVARRLCLLAQNVVWWEVFNRRGQMVDSADMYNEEKAEHEQRIRQWEKEIKPSGRDENGHYTM